MTGCLALLGGGEWQPDCRDLDLHLLGAAGTEEVVVLPTAAAFEDPSTVVAAATAYFKGLGANVRPLMVLSRPDADEAANADTVRSARFVYLSSGSALHLRSVLKHSALWTAIEEAWRNGAVIAGSSAGAMVLGDPMVDPRGGAYTVGLALIENVAVVPHLSEALEHRTLRLAPHGVRVVGIPEETAIVRDGDGSWQAIGANAGSAVVHLDGAVTALDTLP